MDEDVTARDRIWAVILHHVAHDDAFSLSDIRYEIHFDDRPSDDEIRRVLDAALQIGILEETQSGYYTENA
jgi:hypothetical protein